MKDRVRFPTWTLESGRGGTQIGCRPSGVSRDRSDATGQRLGLLELAAEAAAEQVQVLVHLLQDEAGVVLVPGAELFADLVHPFTGDLQPLVEHAADVGQ